MEPTTAPVESEEYTHWLIWAGVSLVLILCVVAIWYLCASPQKIESEEQQALLQSEENNGVQVNP